jgi:TRAP-type C4-dicarboxylate transport system permease small subunit
MKYIIDKIVGFGIFVAGISIALIVALITVEVVGRTFFSYSTLIAEEVSGYLLVCAVFLALGDTARKDKFIRVEIFYNKLRLEYKRIFNIIINLISMAYLFVLLHFTYVYVLFDFNAEIKSVFVSKIPLWIPQSFIVIGLTLVIIYFLFDTMNEMLAIFRAFRGG